MYVNTTKYFKMCSKNVKQIAHFLTYSCIVKIKLNIKPSTYSYYYGNSKNILFEKLHL